VHPLTVLAMLMLVLVMNLAPAFGETFQVTIPEGTSDPGCEENNECYIPFGVNIDNGDTVVWTNEDLAFHTVTSGNPTDGPDGLFDSGMFKIDEQFLHIFEESGNFDYFCTLHPWMVGTVVVQVTLPEEEPENGGGCLIATAAYGSELSPQVQQLREIRDTQLLQTESGSAFMASFNQVYYSFSPYIADYERENPFFKEVVKLAITPLISSLSILNYVYVDSEDELLGYGISLIILNLGMYLGIPIFLVVRGRQATCIGISWFKEKSRNHIG